MCASVVTHQEAGQKRRWGKRRPRSERMRRDSGSTVAGTASQNGTSWAFAGAKGIYQQERLTRLPQQQSRTIFRVADHTPR